MWLFYSPSKKYWASVGMQKSEAMESVLSCGGFHLEVLCFLCTAVSFCIDHAMVLTFCEKVYSFGKCLADLLFKWQNFVILARFLCPVKDKGNCAGRRIGIRVKESEVWCLHNTPSEVFLLEAPHCTFPLGLYRILYFSGELEAFWNTYLRVLWTGTC